MFDLNKKEISKRLNETLTDQSEEIYFEIQALKQYFIEPHMLAAVLIPMLQLNSEWHILFTRRNADLPEHSGQVSFPGGRADPKDTKPEVTALREAHEEIGLEPVDVQILGRMHDFLTITNYQVTPIVGVVPWPYQFYPQYKEVSRIFTIPIKWLANPKNYEKHSRHFSPTGELVSVIYYHPFDGELLWGFTARLTLALIDILRK